MNTAHGPAPIISNIFTEQHVRGGVLRLSEAVVLPSTNRSEMVELRCELNSNFSYPRTRDLLGQNKDPWISAGSRCPSSLKIVEGPL